MNDDELRRRFDELRRYDAKRVPAFDALVSKRPKPHLRRLVAVVPIVAAAAVFLLWCGTTMNKASAPPPVSVRVHGHPPRVRVEGQATMPTDFLLENAPVSVHLDSPGLLP